MDKHQPVKTDEGKLTQIATEEIQRQGEWLTQQCPKPEAQIIPDISHITEESGNTISNQRRKGNKPIPASAVPPEVD